MALNSYLKIKGQKQGAIDGGVTQKGREKSIMVIAASHEIISPRDPASGLPTGKRQHKPFVITKVLDQSSPLLFNSLVNNENLTEWKLDMWRPDPGGTEKLYYTIALTNASIASISMRMPNNKHPDLMKFETYEEIAFTYQKIVVTDTVNNKEGQDDWESPVV